MKRISIGVLAAVLFLGLSGCFSTGFMGFLATTEQVDKKIADEDAKVAAQKAELAKVQQELAEIRGLKDQAQATIDELRSLAKKVEGRMVTLPKETLLKLAEILQNALGQEGQ